MARSFGQYCGVSTALELVGERWALLIVRDLLVGPRRYTDLKQGLPRVPTNILSARLRELQDAGIVRRVALAHCGLVYELTPYGRELEDVVLALGRWGFKAMGAPEDGDVVTIDSLTMALRTAFRPDAARALPDTAYELHVGDVALLATVANGALAVRPVANARPVDLVAATGEAREPQLVVAAGPRIRDVIAGTLAPDAAIDEGAVHVLAGEAALLERFAATFHLDPEVAERAS